MTRSSPLGGRLLASVLAMAAMATMAWPQPKAAAPAALAADLKDAMSKADAGDPAPLVALADSGRADAQYYAAAMYIYGRKKIPADGRRGCAYAEKASASRGDAAYLTGVCQLRGLAGPADAAKAKAAFGKASEMGFEPARCALGQVLMAEQGQGPHGLDLCRQSAMAGDRDAQMIVADAYFRGGPVKADHAQARKFLDMAARQGQPDAARRLGEMYAAGDGGKRDKKKAMELWKTAEKAGDPLAPILVADQLFSDMTGGKTPGPGKFGFRGGIPVSDIEAIEEWYKAARDRDPRPDVKQKAEYALSVLETFKTAAKSVSVSPSG